MALTGSHQPGDTGHIADHDAIDIALQSMATQSYADTAAANAVSALSFATTSYADDAATTAAAAAQAAAAADATAKANAAITAAAAAAQTVKVIAGTTYSPSASDIGLRLKTTNASPVAFSISQAFLDSLPTAGASGVISSFDVWQYGAGQCSITGGGSSTTATFPLSFNAFNNTAGSAFTVVLPTTGAGLADHDDLVVAICTATGSARTFTVSGPGTWNQVSATVGLSGCYTYVFTCLDITASTMSGQTITFTQSGGTSQYALQGAVVRGAARITFIDGTAAVTGATNSSTAPSSTTTGAGDVEINIVGKGNGATAYTSPALTPPGGITKLAEAFTNGSAGNCAVAIGYGSLGGLSASTAIGNRAWTGAGVGNAWTIAVAPYVVAGVTVLAPDGAKTAEQYAFLTVEKTDISEVLVYGKTTT